METTRNNENKVIHRPQWREAVAGASAGIISKTAMAPLERVKLLLQLQDSVAFGRNQSAWNVAAKVYREEGVLSFWRGNLPNVMRTAGASAINFTSMDYYKKVFVSPISEQFLSAEHYNQEQVERQRRALSSFLSGGLAGATSTTVLYPFEFLRTRLAMDVGRSSNRQYHGMVDVVTRIFRTDGIFGFFQGYGVALTGGVFYRVIYLGGYDFLKEEIVAYKNSNDLTWGERIFSAQFTSLFSGTLSYPFDSVRRRMMMQAGLPRNERPFRNSIDCVFQVWKERGIRGFYLGLAPNIFRSVGGALLLVAYDAVRSVL